MRILASNLVVDICIYLIMTLYISTCYYVPIHIKTRGDLKAYAAEVAKKYEEMKKNNPKE